MSKRADGARRAVVALMIAFCGVGETRSFYRREVAARHRLYAFGDAMLVH